MSGWGCDWMKNRSQGFTLIELLTVIAIIGILAAIIIPTVGRVRESARDVTCKSNLRQLGLAVQLYANERGYYPPSVSGGMAESRGGAPAGRLWSVQLRPYLNEKGEVLGALGNSSLIVCPTAPVRPPEGNVSSFSANPGVMPDLSTSATGTAVRSGAVKRPSQVIILGDAIQRDPQGAHSNFWSVPDMTGGDEFSWGSEAQGQTPIQTGSDVDGINEAQIRYRHSGRANVVFADAHVGAFRKGEILRMHVRKNY